MWADLDEPGGIEDLGAEPRRDRLQLCSGRENLGSRSMTWGIDPELMQEFVDKLVAREPGLARFL